MCSSDLHQARANGHAQVGEAAEHRLHVRAVQQEHHEADEGRQNADDVAGVSATLKTVNSRYGELFAGDESLSSPLGSLVFTGVEDDPATLETLTRMGFSSPAQVSSTIRAWHHGRIGATRSERGRELFTRLGPKLLEAARRTGVPEGRTEEARP